MKQSSIAGHLRRLTTGDVLFDEVSREAYATAACLFRIRPLGIVAPRTAQEAARIVQFCAQEGISITPRGAGSSVAGQALGSGLILDFVRYMNRIIELDPQCRTARVEPGLIYGRLDRALAVNRLFFPPDPSSGDYCTLGGMIANNSSGPHSIKYGPTRNWIKSLEVILADGSIARFGKCRLEDPAMDAPALLKNIFTQIPALLSRDKDLIQKYRPRVKNSSGYHLWDIVRDDEMDLAQIIVGSEGTLAVVTAAELNLLPVPNHRTSALIFFDQLEKATASIPLILSLDPETLEIMDHNFITLVRGHNPLLHDMLPEKLDTLLLVELSGETEDQVQEQIGGLRRELLGKGHAAFGFQQARTREEEELIWSVRKAASPILYGLPGKERLTRFVEDVVIPRERLAQGISAIQAILSRHGTSAPILGHAGEGNLHLNPRLNLEDEADRLRMQDIADEIYDLVIGLGGSITGEHGDGILRGAFVKRMFGPLVEVFKEVKNIFDPQGILNPGKIISRDDRLPINDLKFTPHPSSLKSQASILTPQAYETLLRCHGCGHCRTYCPYYLQSPDEKNLPRAKLGVLRALAMKQHGSEDLKEEIAAVLNACYQCQRCLTLCPTRLETALPVREALAQERARKFSPRESLLDRSDKIMAWASRRPGLYGRLVNSRLLRGMMETGICVARDAPFPGPAADLLTRLESPVIGVARSTTPRVLFYPGCLDRYTETGGQANAVLDILGLLCPEIVIPDLPCCGLPLLATGNLAAARTNAALLLDMLAPYLELGMPVITACPACALAMKHEFGYLLGEPAGALADQASEFFAFLATQQELMKALADTATHNNNSRPETHLGQPIAYHRPCHQVALGMEDPVRHVLLRAGVNLAILPDQCCGMGGGFGMKSENRELSKSMSRAIERAAQEAGADTIVSSCGMCRLQIRSTTKLRVVSPVNVLHDLLFSRE